MNETTTIEAVGTLESKPGEWEDSAVVQLQQVPEFGSNHLLLVVENAGRVEVVQGRVEEVTGARLVLRGCGFPARGRVLALAPYRRRYAVHASRSALDEVVGDEQRKLFFCLASNFHGEACVGVGLGVRTALKATELLPVPLQHREVRVECYCQPCMADALQGICAAGNKRLRRRAPLSRESLVRFQLTSRTLELRLTPRKIELLEEALHVSDQELFSAIEWRK